MVQIPVGRKKTSLSRGALTTQSVSRNLSCQANTCSILRKEIGTHFAHKPNHSQTNSCQVSKRFSSCYNLTRNWRQFRSHLNTCQICWVCRYYRLSRSLHLSISLSFCSFLYNGVCWDVLKPSVSDVIVSQKSSNVDGKLQFFGPDYMKKTKNKTRIGQWRLLKLFSIVYVFLFLL